MSDERKIEILKCLDNEELLREYASTLYALHQDAFNPEYLHHADLERTEILNRMNK